MKRTAIARSTTPLVRSPIAKKRGKPLPKKRGTSTAAKKRKAVALWGEYVHKRDIYCQLCGKTYGRMNAHHVMVRRFAATFADPDNGILLCSNPCHALMHDDPLQALQFYSRRFGVDGYQRLREKAQAGVGQTMRGDFWNEAIARLSALLEDEGDANG